MKTLKQIILSCILMLSGHSCSLSDVDKPCTLAGKISKLNGVPLEEVSVELTLAGHVFTTITDAQGEYQFKGFPSGLGILSLKKDKFRPSLLTFVFAGDDAISFDYTMRSTVIEEEEAYLQVPKAKTTINSYDTIAFISVASNIYYSFTCDADWVSYTTNQYYENMTIALTIAPNETDKEREATLFITGTYGLTAQATLVQKAGPASQLTATGNTYIVRK